MMRIPQRWRGKTALITGASSGIGAALARALAEGGAHLVLTARRRERLEALGRELGAKHGVTVDVVPQDLAAPGAARALFDAVRAHDRPVDLLVLNAGFGANGNFQDIAWDVHGRMIQLNAVAPAELVRLFLDPMIARGSGDILLVSSVAAFTPVPTFAVYAATKAFLTQLGEALSHELRHTGVRVTVLNPAGTDTEFLSAAGMKPTSVTHLGMMSADQVARAGLRAMARGKRSVIPGVTNKMLIGLGTRLLPLGLRLRAAALFQRLAGGGEK